MFGAGTTASRQLPALSADPAVAAETTCILRGLIAAIVVTPAASRSGSIAVLEGDLGDLLAFASGSNDDALGVGPRGRSTKLVAGKRNHLVLAPGKQIGGPDERTADLIKRVKLVAATCNRFDLLFEAPDVG